MIRSFHDATTQRIWERRRVPRLAPDLQRRAYRKLLKLDAADCLDSLNVPPGDRLEKLRRERAGQYAIRVTSQFRICFEWHQGGAERVEFADYHP